MGTINLEPVDQDISTGWAIFRFTKLEVSVTVAPKDYESRKVTATLETPEHAPVKVAIQMYPGASTQPENTLSMINIQDKAQELIQTLEDAIEASMKKKQQGEW